jgi:hypothetical protein
MSASSIAAPFPIFTDVDGNPLEAGYIYIGVANQNPETNPISVYWDSAMLYPSAQPIRTSGGYPVRNGTPARLYVASDYSITVRNKNASFIYSSATSTEVISDALIASLSASKLLDTLGYSGATQFSQDQFNDDYVSAFRFMTADQIAAVKAGTTNEDLTAAVSLAVATGKRVYLPGGTWKFNLVINNKTIIFGDGSTKTIVKPYDDTKAAMLYKFAAMLSPVYSYWNYHSEVRDIGFQSNVAKTGVGFSFGKTNPADYATNDEYANNVKFYGCNFQGFDKGLQFPFGNIGTEIYSCGFSGNKYGIYTMDNKFGGTMHAGNKYIFGGEFHSNEVALYINNKTDGFGAISLYGTIIEGNSIGIYAYVTPRVTVPICLNSVWFEGNGYNTGSTSVDVWTGTTRSTTTLDNKTIIIDGDSCKMNVDSGFICDVRLIGTNIEFTASNCRAESSAGYGGGPFVVDNPDSSYVRLINPTSDGGWGNTNYAVQVEGRMCDDGSILNPGTRTQGRPFNTPPRVPGIGSYGSSLVLSLPLTDAATTGGGSFNLSGTVVADGRIFGACNEFTRAAFASSEYTRILTPSSVVTTTDGWYVFTLDAKIVSGAGVRFWVWDRSSAQLAGFECNTVGKWYTFAALSYSPGGQTLYLDFNGDTTWRVSAYQVHRFDTREQAQDFIASRAYSVGGGVVSVASAATITIPSVGDIVNITGTTGITSISATGQAGHRVTLVFAGALTVTDGSNLKLNGNYTTTADDTLTLVCDGTNWYEVSRSAN